MYLFGSESGTTSEIVENTKDGMERVRYSTHPKQNEEISVIPSVLPQQNEYHYENVQSNEPKEINQSSLFEQVEPDLSNTLLSSQAQTNDKERENTVHDPTPTQIQPSNVVPPCANNILRRSENIAKNSHATEGHHPTNVDRYPTKSAAKTRLEEEIDKFSNLMTSRPFRIVLDYQSDSSSIVMNRTQPNSRSNQIEGARAGSSSLKPTITNTTNNGLLLEQSERPIFQDILHTSGRIENSDTRLPVQQPEKAAQPTNNASNRNENVQTSLNVHPQPPQPQPRTTNVSANVQQQQNVLPQHVIDGLQQFINVAQQTTEQQRQPNINQQTQGLIIQPQLPNPLPARNGSGNQRRSHSNAALHRPAFSVAPGPEYYHKRNIDRFIMEVRGKQGSLKRALKSRIRELSDALELDARQQDMQAERLLDQLLFYRSDNGPGARTRSRLSTEPMLDTDHWIQHLTDPYRLYPRYYNNESYPPIRPLAQQQQHQYPQYNRISREYEPPGGTNGVVGYSGRENRPTNSAGTVGDDDVFLAAGTAANSNNNNINNIVANADAGMPFQATTTQRQIPPQHHPPQQQQQVRPTTATPTNNLTTTPMNRGTSLHPVITARRRSSSEVRPQQQQQQQRPGGAGVVATGLLYHPQSTATNVTGANAAKSSSGATSSSAPPHPPVLTAPVSTGGVFSIPSMDCDPQEPTGMRDGGRSILRPTTLRQPPMRFAPPVKDRRSVTFSSIDGEIPPVPKQKQAQSQKQPYQRVIYPPIAGPAPICSIIRPNPGALFQYVPNHFKR